MPIEVAMVIAGYDQAVFWPGLQNYALEGWATRLSLVPAANARAPNSHSGAMATLGGLSVLLGYRAEIGAWLIVLFLLGVTPMMHKFWAVSDPMMSQIQFVMFLKNLSMMGAAALIITQRGSGPWSLDGRK